MPEVFSPCPHGQSQRVDFNDNRWLDLCLSFDGLGLNSEVTYFDPALAPELMQEDSAEASPFRTLSRPEPYSSRNDNVLSWPGVSSILASVRSFLRPMAPSPVIAWSLVLACVLGVAGYFVFRSPKPAPILNALDLPPTQAMHWSPLSSIDLFKELRGTILTARIGACLPEDELIALYGPDRFVRLATIGEVQEMLQPGHPLRAKTPADLLSEVKPPWGTRLYLEGGRAIEKRAQRPPQTIQDFLGKSNLVAVSISNQRREKE